MWNESELDSAKATKAVLDNELVQQAIKAYRAESFKKMQHMRYYGGGDSKLDDITDRPHTLNDIMNANGWSTRELAYYQKVYYGPYTYHLRTLRRPQSPDHICNKLVSSSISNTNQWAEKTFSTYLQAYSNWSPPQSICHAKRQAHALLENFVGEHGDLEKFERYFSEQILALNTDLGIALETSEDTFMPLDDVLVEKYNHLVANGLQERFPYNIMDNSSTINAHRQHHIFHFFSSTLTPDVNAQGSVRTLNKHVRIQENENHDGVCEGAFIPSNDLSYPQKMDIIHSDEEYSDNTCSWSSDEDEYYANNMY